MPPVSPLSTQVSMRNMQVVDDVCRSAFGCGGIDLAAVAVVALLGLLTVLVLAAIVHVTEAMSIVEEECVRLAAERDAFDDFARRVATMEVAESAATMPAGGIATSTAASRADPLADVRAAYRDTVMAVDHYADDYGEPLAENVAAELGDELAYAVAEGEQFPPALQSALVDASREASHRRTSFLSTLAAEEEALAEAAETIEAIDEEHSAIADAPLSQRSWPALVDDWERLGELQERCREAIRDRQERNRALPAGLSPEREDLHEYLYATLPVSHPVLADLTALVDRISDRRRHLLRAITRRV